MTTRDTPEAVDKAVDHIEAILQPRGRCSECGGGEFYWRHSREEVAAAKRLDESASDFHEFRPTRDTPEAICQTECTSGCHADDCEHHGHLPARSHQHIGPLGSITCDMKHAEPPADLVPRDTPDGTDYWPDGEEGYPARSMGTTRDTPEAARLRESLLAAKAANTNVLRTLAYRGLDKGHPGIFAREVEAAIDAALSGTEYQPLDEAHGAQVGWTRDRLRAALAESPRASEPWDKTQEGEP